MKAAIFNPYLDTLGGGERYTLAVASTLADHGYRVDLQWTDTLILAALEKRFGLKLNNINIVNSINRGDGYDLCFWVSDGSVPMLRARKNLLHFQVPFIDVGGDSLINRMKFFRINKVICNSQFTKGFIDQEYKVNSIVLYPPVPVNQMKAKKKENLIIAVGRFSQLTQSKHQDVLVEAFKQMYDGGLKDWKLVLAGGADVGADEFLKKLKNDSEGYPIRILESPPFSQIQELYGTAKIYWSASGYGVDEQKEPKKVEHFGISVVEAMAAECVPLVYAAGGHKESIVSGVNGCLWKEISELIQLTTDLIKTKKTMQNFSKQAKKDSRKYNYDEFAKALLEII